MLEVADANGAHRSLISRAGRRSGHRIRNITFSYDDGIP